MILSELVQLFDRSSTTLTETEQGALLSRIELAKNKVFNESFWATNVDVAGIFQDMGGSIKPMPQGILLRAIPDEHGGGRCYPLVYAMSVALASSEFAIDQLCAKLGALCPSKESDMESAAMFKRSLEDLHTSYLATEVSKPIRHMKFEDAIGILMNSTDNTMIAMHTEVHSMLLGVTRKGNSTGWYSTIQTSLWPHSRRATHCLKCYTDVTLP
ncbi:Mediator of RNA polymerase II transcription subunit 5 [Metarhizium robertsii ARSEF 23]|uniref:Mediator of RNA polymerase II transcription subunit 5 n=1 Tax=Metarhizium robertsii (strain ARSEF 23 / ATCC MYA-3075) TaxID=655844 RepID=A0A0B2XDP9_METRA|nr:Mediator of RNA polymerase II transcription subunit 5 [Metarhizium robertsii ARSEF 23]KHO10880.1 Mediator of RNA polymerase II transcription subunit 5 [Metarhizium robertsii ARSEF 23]